MDTLTISFASLVKSNNGEFKSDKQAKFLLSKCIDNAYMSFGQVYNSKFSMTYHCDDKGVYKVVKSTKKNLDVTTWERKTGQSAIDAKQSARIAKDRKNNRVRIYDLLAENEHKRNKMVKLITNGELKNTDIVKYLNDNKILNDVEEKELQTELKSFLDC